MPDWSDKEAARRAGTVPGYIGQNTSLTDAPRPIPGAGLEGSSAQRAAIDPSTFTGLYNETDTGQIWRSDGTSWARFGTYALANVRRTLAPKTGLSPYDPNNITTSNGPRIIGSDPVAGVTFWASSSTIFLSSTGVFSGAIADPGGNLGKPPGVTSAFTVLSMRRLGSQAFWICLALDAGTGFVGVYRAPVVAPGTALVWTLLKAGQSGLTATAWGLDCSADGTVICWGEYSLTIGNGLCRILRSADSGSTWSTAYTISSTSKHMHDVYRDPYTANRWVATAGDGPATTTDYLLVSTDNGATWASQSPSTVYPPAYQSVHITRDDPAAGRGGRFFAAPDVTYCDLITIDPTTFVPSKSISDHNRSARVINPGRYANGAVTKDTTTLTDSTSNPFVKYNDEGRKVTSLVTANAAYTDGVFNTDTSLVSATAGFTSDDVGKTVTGTGIPASTTIASVTNATTVVLSQATTTTGSGKSFTITSRQVIRSGTTVASVTSASAVVLSQAAAATVSSGLVFLIDRQERLMQNNYMGRVDPADGTYYFVANDDASGPSGAVPRYALLAMQAGDSQPIVLAMLPQAPGGGIWIDATAGKVFAGMVGVPLLSAATLT